jgi:hypothetical protein
MRVRRELVDTGTDNSTSFAEFHEFLEEPFRVIGAL